MSAHLIAQRYAGALATSVEDDAHLTAVLNALQDFSAIYAEHDDLGQVLENHALPQTTREAVFREVLDRADAPDVVQRFLLVLFRRSRISAIDDVVSALSEIVDLRLNRVRADVTAATELGEEELKKIESGLETYSGKTVQMEIRIDPEILGGIIVRLGDTVIDGSLRARLDRIRATLLTEETS